MSENIATWSSTQTYEYNKTFKEMLNYYQLKHLLANSRV